VVSRQRGWLGYDDAWSFCSNYAQAPRSDAATTMFRQQCPHITARQEKRRKRSIHIRVVTMNRRYGRNLTKVWTVSKFARHGRRPGTYSREKEE
jgi:hypothetical protein